MALTDKLTAIANAIRAKTGKSGSLTLDDMPTEIASISGGGGGGGAASVTVTGLPYSMYGAYVADDGSARITTLQNGTKYSVLKGSAVTFLQTFLGSVLVSGGGNVDQNFGYKTAAITGDSVTLQVVVSCFLPGTLITLADGTKKPIENISYDDVIRVWDFDNGCMGEAGVCWLTTSGLRNDHYYRITFDDGTVLRATGQNSNHKFFNVDTQRFEGVAYCEVGDRIYGENGIVTVAAKEYIEEEIEYFNLMTDRAINCFADGILTSDRYGNLYPIADMRYIKEDRYLRPYSEFEAAGVARYWYDHIRLGESTDSMETVKDYVAKCECQMSDLERVKAYAQR